MLLKEMFSPIGAPKEDQEDIDWLDDLKFYIDNDDHLLNNYFFPAVDKHQMHKGNPNVYKLYVRPVEHACEHYCKRFEITDREEKFPKEKLIDLAKRIAQEQESHLTRGDYESQ